MVAGRWRNYPHQSRIRHVSLDIAVVVAEVAFAQKTTSLARPETLRAFIQAQLYAPEYQDYVE